MRRLRALFVRLGGIFGKSRRDHELAAELESHLQMHIDDNLRAGMTPQEGRRRAIVKLGGVESTKESYRERRSIPIIETLLQDLRFGLRMLRRNPGFAIAVVLTLALCIGANTAVFSVVHSVILQPLGFREPDRLVVLRERGARGSGVSIPDSEAWRAESDIFEGVGVYKTGPMILKEADDFQRVYVGTASPELFRIIGVRPIQGRALLAEDSVNGTGAAVLSEAFWHSHFGSKPTILGETIRLGDDAVRIVGIVPIDAPFQNVAFWLPLRDSATLEKRNNRSFFGAIARLSPHVSIEQARSQMRVVDSRLMQVYSGTNSGWTTTVDALKDVTFGDSTRPVYLLFGATCFLLLLGCANVANLLVGRAIGRRKEVAARIAMGAGAARILRQLLIESSILASVGGAAGLVFAYWAIKILISDLPNNLPRLSDTRLDGAVLLFNVAVTIVTALLFGALPAIISRNVNPAEILKGIDVGVRHSSANYLRNAVVVIQCAAATMLLVGASLTANSMEHLYRASVGLEPTNAIVMQFQTVVPISSSAGRSASQVQRSAVNDFVQEVRAEPWVLAVGAISDFPLQPVTEHRLFFADRDPTKAVDTSFSAITPGYFQAAGTPLLSGREFSNEDSPGDGAIVILNEAAARTFWPDGLALGRQIVSEMTHETVVGVVADVRRLGLKGYSEISTPQVFALSAQSPDVPLGWMVVRTVPEAKFAQLELKSRALRKGTTVVPVNIQTLDQLISRVVGPGRQLAMQFGFISVLAAILAIVGISSVLLRFVRMHLREIGIRVALGASVKDISRWIVGKGLRLIVIGILIGLVAAAALSHLMKAVLFEIGSLDALSFLTAAGLMMVAGIVGCCWPVVRALAVDPASVLRNE